MLGGDVDSRSWTVTCRSVRVAIAIEHYWTAMLLHHLERDDIRLPGKENYFRRGLYPFLRLCGLSCWFSGTWR